MIPNCVPEFYREIEERERIKYEKQLQREDEYRNNRELLDYASAGGLYVLDEVGCANECFECRKRTPCLQRDEDDDFGLFICLARFCVYQDGLE